LFFWLFVIVVLFLCHLNLLKLTNLVSSNSSAFIFSPSSSIIYGEGLVAQPVCSGQLSFELLARDKCGNNLTTGGVPLNVTITVDNASGVQAVPNTVTDHHDGSYTVTFAPVIAGFYTFYVTSNGIPWQVQFSLLVLQCDDTHVIIYHITGHSPEKRAIHIGSSQSI